MQRYTLDPGMTQATADHASAAVTTDEVDVEFRAVTKRFGSLTAVNSVNLQVRRGEFLSLLGPSGCGKTTSLRMIAGFEQPDEGEILIGGRDATGTPPYKRQVNTVFQQYSLFPHMCVLDNVAFGLKQRRVGKRERHAQAREALELVRLQGRERERPRVLSGGQQQRVALARALVMRPQVLLLDEPLGALDLKLRKTLQVELKALQSEVGITFVFVTHDQEEALTMSDRIAVMNNGRVEQAASPRTIYDEPLTVFVADFLGVSNLLSGEAVGPDGGACSVRVGDRMLRAQQGAVEARGEVKVMIRPERIGIEPHATTGEERLPGMVERAVFLGGAQEVHVRVLGGELLKATIANDGSAPPVELEPGTAVSVRLPADALRVLVPSEPPAGAGEQAQEDPATASPIAVPRT